MKREVQEPTVTESSLGGDVQLKFDHPAYAQIRVNRCQGGNQVLYGSDFVHNHYITVEITGSTLCRSLNRDWNYAREHKIEVALSEAQWGAFVSSFGVGGGVPCTLLHERGKLIPRLPDPVGREQQFHEEMDDRLIRMMARFRDGIEAIDGLGLPKAKAAIAKEALVRSLQDVESNIGFVMSQFDKHMENTVEAAKAEVHGYVSSTLTRMGLESALAHDAVPFTLEDHSTKED
jgi:hypothetical protein